MAREWIDTESTESFFICENPPQSFFFIPAFTSPPNLLCGRETLSRIENIPTTYLTEPQGAMFLLPALNTRQRSWKLDTCGQFDRLSLAVVPSNLLPLLCSFDVLLNIFAAIPRLLPDVTQKHLGGYAKPGVDIVQISLFGTWLMFWVTADQWAGGAVVFLFFWGLCLCVSLRAPACGAASIRPRCVSSHKWPFNRLFRTLTPRLLLPPLSLFLLYTCVRLGPLICGELFLGSPTGTLVCVYSSVRMPPFHKFDMPFCCHGKPSLKIYISAFGLDGFLSLWFRACCPQGQI